MSGSCSASWARAARSEPCCSDVRAKTTASRVGSREPGRRLLARPRLADRIVDPDRTEAADRRHLAGDDDVATRRTGRGEDADRGRLRVPSPADRHTLAGVQRAGEQARVRDALAASRPLDLEDAAGDRRVRVAIGAAEELVDAGQRAPLPRSRAPPSRSTRDGRRRAESGRRARRADRRPIKRRLVCRRTPA